MARPEDRSGPLGPDGVRISRRRGGTERACLLLLAGGVVGLALGVLVRLMLPRRSDAVAARGQSPASAAPSAIAPAADRGAPTPPTSVSSPTPRPRRKTFAAPRPTSDRAPAATGATPDVPSAQPGIAVYPPAGTSPPKPGVIVPDDFVLPEGYVRHYQSTDDGEQLAPILMFHPDYEFVDPAGSAIPLPADRVVPPELVPPGLTINTLRVPDTHVPPVHHEDGTPFEIPAR